MDFDALTVGTASRPEPSPTKFVAVTTPSTFTFVADKNPTVDIPTMLISPWIFNLLPGGNDAP